MLSHSIDVRVTNMYRGVGTHEIALSRCCCVVLCSAAAAALVRHATSCHLMLSLLFSSPLSLSWRHVSDAVCVCNAKLLSTTPTYTTFT